MYPQYINYYIGTSQGISSLIDEVHKFNFVKNQALKRNENNVISKLQQFGSPNGYCYPRDDKEAKVFVTKMIHKYGGYIYDKKSFSLLKMVLSYIKCYKLKTFNVFKGMLKSSSILNAEMNCEDKITPISHLDVPVLFISGENDAVCPVAATQDWFDRLEAPEKHFVKVENAAHMVNFEKSEIWNRLVIQLLK